MAEKYFQIGPDVTKPPYAGGNPAAAHYSGRHKTVALPATAADGDTVEIPLFEIPAGARISTLKWAIGASLGTATSAKIVLRKKTNVINPSTTVAGGGGQATGTVASDPDKTVQIDGSDSSVTTTAAGNAVKVIVPATFEGLATPKETLQEAYLVSLLVAFSTAPTWVTGVDVFVAAEGEFVGTL